MNNLQKKRADDYFWPACPHVGVELICGNKKVYDVGWGGRNINDPFCRLYMLKSGSGLVACGDYDLRLEPGYLYLVPDGVRATYSCDVSICLMWVHFRLEFVQGISYFSGRPAVAYDMIEGSEDLFEALLDGLDGCPPSRSLVKYAQLLQLLQPFVNDAGEGSVARDAVRLRPALDALRLNPEKPFNLTSLARKVGLHPTYFSNLFKKAFGVTPGYYHLEQRMLLARKLLRSSDMILGEVAEQCGYSDAFHFARMFRKHVGVSPGKYRKAEAFE